MTALWHPASVGDRRRQHVTLYHEDRIEKIGEDAGSQQACHAGTKNHGTR